MSDDTTNHPKRYYASQLDSKAVETTIQVYDPHEYERWKASRKLGLPEWELADTPDYDNRLDNIDEGT